MVDRSLVDSRTSMAFAEVGRVTIGRQSTVFRRF